VYSRLFEDETLRFHTQPYPDLIAMQLEKRRTRYFTHSGPLFVDIVTFLLSPFAGASNNQPATRGTQQTDLSSCRHAYRSTAIPRRQSNKFITFQRQNLPKSLLAFRKEEQLVPALHAMMQVVVASKHQLKLNPGHKTNNKLPTPRHHALNKADKSYATIRQILVGIAR
jgi:hypothetical protein